MKKSIKGNLVVEYTPAKQGYFRVHDPMVTLTFEIDGAGTLQLACYERSDALTIYRQLRRQMKVVKGWEVPFTLSHLEV